MTKAAAIREAHRARPHLTFAQLGDLFGCSAGLVRLILERV